MTIRISAELPFPMVADIKRELSTALGVLDKKEGVALRATFIVDPQGAIRFVSVNVTSTSDAIRPRCCASSMRCRPTSFARAIGKRAKTR